MDANDVFLSIGEGYIKIDSIILVLSLVLSIFGLIYFYFQRKFSYWSSRGVKGPKPSIPLGNVWNFIRIGQVKLETEWLTKYGKVYGNYLGPAPILTIADAELIKQVMVKDFHVFVNRDVANFDHEIWSTNLFNSEDEQWRRIRAITSPSFTTGKLKGMHKMMNRCVDKLAEYFDQVIKSKEGKMNAKEVVTGFTLDVIASTSFATETNANDAKGSKENVFLKYATTLFSGNPFYAASFFIMPKWFNKLIGNEIGVNPRSFNFFVSLSKEIVRQRKSDVGGGKRNDLVQLLLDAFVYEDESQKVDYNKLTATEDETPETGPKTVTKSSVKKSLTENEIIAQCILFFGAGFETTASTITNCLYHLALNPDVDERLNIEITQHLDGLDVDSNEYLEKVNTQMSYLEAVIKETLRICPPVPRLQRRVGVHGFKLAGIPLDKDTEVNVTTYGVHHMAEYYPEPERFKPERFLPENKHLLVPYTYLPFGVGPRNCIGMRFAYQEIKLCLAKIIRDFKFSTTPETKIPLDYSKFGVLFIKDVPLRVSRR